ncbi:FAD/NAD(P)-binding domain-containing protein [Pseudovirgaria hyperparasitica]|uniref:FAD/NAD(P)-binding domain-containing protein n=1 Tax=Pseudovirgaria hyperparasitica TaxID=470096 RepID=A0A6A6W000_9PEZI|nr:FAD/NAD(P)-binding domain-containing protein [Pseudovirgaria hyperparasitica]KAF2755873.1 FAD/NAD(P)-binding domain-containing protein [Pseudovirgaria hyperparasitica]
MSAQVAQPNRGIHLDVDHLKRAYSPRSPLAEGEQGATLGIVGIDPSKPKAIIDSNIHVEDKLRARQRYREERAKRLGGFAQYLDPASSQHLSRFAEDPWIDPVRPNFGAAFPERCRFLIVGTGISGLLYARNLIKGGFKVGDIHMIDTAGGFGGSWYWNRYPGIMCDLEASIYLPVLEDLNYTPKDRYASGEEIRGYLNSLAEHYSLPSVASFQTQARFMQWDEENKEYNVTVTQKQSGQTGDREVHFKADFVIMAAGVLDRPKLPAVPGIDSFGGDSFHTARWDYSITGGAPGKGNYDLFKLQDKKVAIVGTGATAVQAVPHLAKYAKHLYVIQRTPAAVDARDNKAIDPRTYAKDVATHPGWQRERQANFNAFTNKEDPLPSVNMVNDEWTRFNTYCAVLGTGHPGKGFDGSREKLGDYIELLHEIDIARQEKIRRRLDTIVRDSKTADLLKPWYAGWCKRPCFHDEYLDSFNQSNVTLVYTNGKSIEGASASGLLVNGKEIDVDVIIWSTGFNPTGMIDPATRAGGMQLIGRNGVSMRDTFDSGVATLHGVISRHIPNVFFAGPLQAANAVNYTYTTDCLSEHCVYMIQSALRRSGGAKVALEPSEQGVLEWGNRIAKGASLLGAVVGCTPGYLNGEGAADRPKSAGERAKGARGATYTGGSEAFMREIGEWRREGSMKGMEVRVQENRS